MEKQEIKNTLVLILYWASNVFLAAFTTGYLTQKGYSDMQIGLSMSIGAVFIILINYYFNDYLDKLVSKHLKSTIIITYASCIILCLLFIFRTKPDWLNVVIFSLLCSLMTHNHRLINLLCQRQKHSHHLIDGNRPADIGLISYGLTTVLFGYIIRKTTVFIILNLYVAFAFTALLAIVLLLKDEASEKAASNNKVDIQKAIGLLKKNKTFALFLVASFLSALGSLAGVKFLIRIVRGAGGDSLNHGIALAIQMLITLPITKNSEKIKNKYKVEDLLVISFFFSFLKIVLLLVANNVYTIYLSMACSLLGVGLFNFSSAAFSKQINDENDEYMAHQLEVFVGSLGVAPVFGGILAGVLMSEGSYPLLLKACAYITLLAFLIQIYITLRNKKK